jgi:ankyrin repeat protein
VFCQLLYLRRCIPGRIRHALNELPKTLDATYARTLEEIDEQNWKYAHRLFQCVVAASRPLRVNELAEFLTFDFKAGSTPTFLADWRLEDPAHTVLSICSSLLTVVKIPGGTPVVQFAHFSVKEYLTSARLVNAKDSISHFHVSMTPAHTIVAQACLGVLLHLDETVTKDSLENFSLAEYAAEHWVGHAMFENVSSYVEDGMKRLFDPSKRHVSLWTWICDPQSYECRVHQYPEGPKEARAAPLHYAAFCGVHDVVKFLIFEHSQDVNARGFDDNETPLHAAVHGGHADIALLLLEHGADAKAQDDRKRTPLHVASQDGHVKVARVLLEHGADTEARDREEYNPLDRASKWGHVEVARVLLEQGADVKAQDKRNFTALHLAEREEVARLLLEYGADPNALTTDGQTPLHYLSSNRHVGVVRVLLEHGADANARDASNNTQLHRASDRGEHDAVRLLLQYSADIHARDDEGRTPFMRATGRNRHDVIQILLEHGAEDHRAR